MVHAVAADASITRIFWEHLIGTTRTSCMTMFIVAGTDCLTKTTAFTGIPRELAEWSKACTCRCRR